MLIYEIIDILLVLPAIVVWTSIFFHVLVYFSYNWVWDLDSFVNIYLIVYL